MIYIPHQTPAILTEEAFPHAIEQIHKDLLQCREEGYFDSHDKNPLYYEAFFAADAVGAVVLVHGLSEFTRKFYEMAYYLLQAGYHVFVYDQRGHGKSFRMTKRADVLHVDRFSDYAKDLHAFIEGVVRPKTDLPIFLYAHSMGGLVTALYLIDHKDAVEKAVMSAPMIEPYSVDLPRWMVVQAVWLSSRFLAKQKFPLSHDFNPEYAFEKSVDASRSRFDHNMKLRLSDKAYQTSPMSYSWTYGSLVVGRRLLKKGKADSIKTPILLLSAQNDSVVRNDMQEKFAAACPVCSFVTIPDTNHGMLTGSYETMVRHISQTLSFFAGEEIVL